MLFGNENNLSVGLVSIMPILISSGSAILTAVLSLKCMYKIFVKSKPKILYIRSTRNKIKLLLLNCGNLNFFIYFSKIQSIKSDAYLCNT